MELETKSIRIEALRSMRWSVFLLVFAFSAMLYIDAQFKSVIHIIGRFIIIPMAILCLPFMINCIELISGKNILTYSLSWNNLKGWQRGILGTVIVIVSFVIIFFIGFTIAMQLYGPNS